MKKLFIGLLIIAAGAGTFYFLQKKKSETGNFLQKELLTGKWKLDSIEIKKDSNVHFMTAITAIDSNFPKLRYDFRKDGNILVSLKDSVKADSSRYEWTKTNELLLREKTHDSTSEVYSVIHLTNDTLLLQSKDSAVFVFTRQK
jgi:hypothetical protein